jgi:hypothetical protein
MKKGGGPHARLQFLWPVALESKPSKVYLCCSSALELWGRFKKHFEIQKSGGFVTLTCIPRDLHLQIRLDNVASFDADPTAATRLPSMPQIKIDDQTIAKSGRLETPLLLFFPLPLPGYNTLELPSYFLPANP